MYSFIHCSYLYKKICLKNSHLVHVRRSVTVPRASAVAPSRGGRGLALHHGPPAPARTHASHPGVRVVPSSVRERESATLLSDDDVMWACNNSHEERG